MKTVFSGIQPSGLVHLGNLLGAINNYDFSDKERSHMALTVLDPSFKNNPTILNGANGELQSELP